MSNKYYYNINTDENNNHEVHVEGCAMMPLEKNTKYIGAVSSCSVAIALVIMQTNKKNFDGCFYCCNYCHKG